MLHKTVLYGATLAWCLTSVWACGPKCPEIKSAMSQEEIENDDTARINGLVKRRKAVIAEAEKGQQPSLTMERFRFSVTAYEQAIELQLRISELMGTSAQYAQHSKELTDMRCTLDAIIEQRNLEDGDVVLSDREGRDIQQLAARLGELFGGEGKIRAQDLKTYYEQGIGLENEPPATAPAPAATEPAPVPEPATSEGAPADNKEPAKTDPSGSPSDSLF